MQLTMQLTHATSQRLFTGNLERFPSSKQAMVCTYILSIHMTVLYVHIHSIHTAHTFCSHVILHKFYITPTSMTLPHTPAVHVQMFTCTHHLIVYGSFTDHNVSLKSWIRAIHTTRAHMDQIKGTSCYNHMYTCKPEIPTISPRAIL